MELTLHSAGKGAPGDPEAARMEQSGDGLRATFVLREGQVGGVVLESMGGQPRAVPPAEITRLADDTEAYWKSWLARSTYTGRWREMVSRSAMTLKLLTYQPTGATSTTSSITEQRSKGRTRRASPWGHERRMNTDLRGDTHPCRQNDLGK